MMSPICYLIMLLIMIILPIIFYTLFFLINCPPNPFAFFQRRSINSNDSDLRSSKVGENIDSHDKSIVRNDREFVIMSTKLGKDVECPICLSIFVDGEEIRQLKTCKHLFHKGCIDKWLSTQFNCPICRAFVINHYKTKENQIRILGSINIDRSDLWQGSPDSSGLV